MPEIITTVYTADTKQVTAEVNKLIKTNQKAEASAKGVGTATEKASQKAAAALKKLETAAQKREKRIQQEIQLIKRLEARRQAAFDPKRIERFNKAIAKSQARIKTLGVQTRQSSKAMGFFNNTIAKVGATIIAAFAVERIISVTKEVVNLAKEAQGVTAAFGRLGDPALLSELRNATKGTVSDLELMRNAVQAKNFEVPLESLGKLFQFAGQRARETGQDVQFLVDSIILGIGRKSPLILDNLGISSVRLRQELKGVGTEMATVADITKAMTTIIDEELNPAMVNFLTEADKIDKATAQFENLQVVMGRELLPVLGEFSVVLADVFAQLGEENLSTFEKFLGFINRSERSLNNARVAAREFITAQAELAASTSAIPPALQNLVDLTTELVDGFDIETSTLKELSVELKKQKDLLVTLDRDSDQFIITLAVIEGLQKEMANSVKTANDRLKEQIKLFQQRKTLREAETADILAAEEEERLLGEQLEKQLDIQKAHDEELKTTAEDLNASLDKLDAERTKVHNDNLDEQNEKFFENLEKRKEAREKFEAEAVQGALAITGALVNLNQAVTASQIAELEARRDAGRISDEQFIMERKAVQREAARTQKALATFEAVVNTAVAVSAALKIDPAPNIPLGILAGVLGGLQVAAIQARPLPAFKEGGLIDGPGTGTSDSILARVSKGEFVVPAKESAQHIGILEGIRNKNLDQVIAESYLPGIIKDNIKGNSPATKFDLKPLRRDINSLQRHGMPITNLSEITKQGRRDAIKKHFA